MKTAQELIDDAGLQPIGLTEELEVYGGLDYSSYTSEVLKRYWQASDIHNWIAEDKFPSEEKLQEIKELDKNLIPVEERMKLADIMIARWQAYKEKSSKGVVFYGGKP